MKLDTPPRPPTAIGRFRVDAILGSGGMGDVYKAFDPTLQRTIAVKTVRPDIKSAEFLERLYREAQACARLTHPNIVTVYEAGEIGGVVYMAMEYLQGENLGDALHRADLTVSPRLRMLVDILDALQHAHAEGVVHRDIKPSNVFRRSDGTIKLVDFGISRIVAVETLTATGAMIGTPHYASPEQLRAEAVDGRTDIYSTGVLAYEMISGRRPFERNGDSVTSLVLRVLSEPPPPMNVMWTDAFPDIERIVTRAMAKAPQDRYQSADEMKNELSAFLARSGDALALLEMHPYGSGELTQEARRWPAAGKVEKPQTAWRRRRWTFGTAAAGIILAALFQPGWLGSSETEAPQITAALSSEAPVEQPAASPPPLSNIAAPPPPSGGDRAAGRALVRRPEGLSPVTPALLQASPAAQVPPADLPKATVKASTAKDLFDGLTAPGLRYRVAQKLEDREVDVDPATAFRSGDRVRFVFESNIDGYLYVAQQGSSGRWTVLFPSPEINEGRNRIRRSERYTVPPDGWFAFDETPGTERVFVFLSVEPLRQLPGFERPVNRVEVIAADVVNDLQRTIRPRDLVFQKDRSRSAGDGQMNYVVNSAELANSVTAIIALQHGK